ncbi:MAG TPA: hypothetical protein VLU91_02160 [Nitrososphaerales archaeon]|nr:hypothetical protein [Nitrososphaerales archaeon]
MAVNDKKSLMVPALSTCSQNLSPDRVGARSGFVWLEADTFEKLAPSQVLGHPGGSGNISGNRRSMRKSTPLASTSLLAAPLYAMTEVLEITLRPLEDHWS